MNGGLIMIVGFLLARIGGYSDGYVKVFLEKEPIRDMLRHKIATILKPLGKIVSILGILTTIVSVALDDKLTMKQKIAQVGLAFLSAFLSSVATIGFLASPLGFAFVPLLAMIASIIISMALTVVANDYFSFDRYKISRRYIC